MNFHQGSFAGHNARDLTWLPPEFLLSLPDKNSKTHTKKKSQSSTTPLVSTLCQLLPGPLKQPYIWDNGCSLGWLQWESSPELQPCSHCCLPSSRHQNPEHAACTEQPPHPSPPSTYKQHQNLSSRQEEVRRAAWKDSWGSSTFQHSVILFISVFPGWRRKNTGFWKLSFFSPALGTTHQVKRYCECILTTYSMQSVFTLAFLCSCREPFQDNSRLYLFETCHCGRVICFLYFISSYIYISYWADMLLPCHPPVHYGNSKPLPKPCSG